MEVHRDQSNLKIARKKKKGVQWGQRRDVYVCVCVGGGLSYSGAEEDTGPPPAVAAAAAYGR